MHSKTLNTVDADSNAHKAAINAAYRNAAMRCTYTTKQQSAVQQVVDAVSTAYNYDHVYTNYRKNFIAIKFTALRVRNKQYAKQIELAFADRNYTVVKTKQGTIVRIAK